MSRAIWFVAGAGAGVYGMVKARRVQEALTPDGLRDRGRALALGARMVREELGQARVEKEHELRERLGLPQLAPPANRQLPAAPDHQLPAPRAAEPVLTPDTRRTDSQTERGSN